MELTQLKLNQTATTFKNFQFNDCGSCLNPEAVYIDRATDMPSQGLPSIEIEVFEGPQGWGCNTGAFTIMEGYSRGGGIDVRFPSRYAAIDYGISSIKAHENIFKSAPQLAVFRRFEEWALKTRCAQLRIF